MMPMLQMVVGIPTILELINNGFKIVIYANHLLRASYKAMYETAEKILINQRAFESEKKITSINSIISLIKL
jgi:phosphoenolpyruvate phosphomutase